MRKDGTARRPAAGWASATWLLLWVVALWRFQPPGLPHPEPGEESFSADRAFVQLRRLDPEQRPHPVGSAHNTIVRERVRQAFADLGLEPQEQRAWSCRPGVVCAPVTNIMARVPGEVDGPAVMVAAHHDSVHAGPGSGDDLHGVAILLEVAHALQSGPPPRNPVILLSTDGEEVGLLGARAFVRSHPWADDVAVVVNLEARGTSGRSNMFETSDGNAALIEVMHEVPSPSATSLAYEVYKRMPNDTDFTVYRQAGMAGLNFAFVGNVAHYHTPLDDLEHLDARSVHHQGSSAWAVIGALANRPLDDLQGSDAVYLDVLGMWLWSAPAATVLPIAVGSLLAVLVLAVVLRRRREMPWSALGWGLAATLGALLMMGLAVALTDRLIIGIADAAKPWYATPQPHRYALLVTAVVVGGAWVVPLGRRAGVTGTMLGLAFVWATLNLLLAVVVPGAAPFTMLPTLALLVSLSLLAWVSPVLWRDVLALVLPAVFTASLWIPLGLGLEQTLGYDVGLAVAAPWLLGLTALAPDAAALSAGRAFRVWHRIVAMVAWLVVVGIASQVEPYDTMHPRRLTVSHLTNADTREGWLLVQAGAEPLPEPMTAVASFEHETSRPLPLMGSALRAPASPRAVAAPVAEVMGEQHVDGRRLLSVRLRSRRRADRIALVFGPEHGVTRVTVEDAPAMSVGSRRSLMLFGVPPQGVSVELEIDAANPLQADLFDISADLPPAAQTLIDARPPWAVTSQWGDTSVVQTTVQL